MIELQDKEYWNTAWDKYFDHYQQDLRHAYYINAFLNNDEHKILEIAAGSFRDFHLLNKLGRNCFAFDYCEKHRQESEKIISPVSRENFPAKCFFNKLSR